MMIEKGDGSFMIRCRLEVVDRALVLVVEKPWFLSMTSLRSIIFEPKPPTFICKPRSQVSYDY